MIKSLFIATLLLGSVASAKVDVEVGPSNPAPIVTPDYSDYYARECVKSVRKAIRDNGGQVNYITVTYANNNVSTVYAEYSNTSCYGPYNNMCYTKNSADYFNCYNGQY